MKKYLAILLTAAMLLCAAPLAGFTAVDRPEMDFGGLFPTAKAAEIVDSGTCGAEGDGSNLTWTLDSDGLLTISGSGAMKYAFWKGNNAIRSVVVQQGVTNIASSAFAECKNLTSVIIPASVAQINDCAFSGCINLSDVIIPEGVESIDQFAFCECVKLVSITIPGSITHIREGAFSDCKGLTSVKLSEGLEWIGISAFYGCSSLISIEIPASVSVIGHWVFSECTALKDLTVKEENTTYLSKGNCIIEKATKTLIVGCDNAVIPADGNVLSIGYYAFEYCTGLTSMTIPDSVTKIGGVAFEGCTNLTSITIPSNVTEIGRDAIPKNTVIYGFSASYAQQWAEENGRAFIARERPATPTDPENPAAPTDPDQPAYTPGDVDGDGEVTSGDARLALRASVQLEKYEPGTAAFLAADADKNGEIESSDARTILRVSVRLEAF